MICVTLHEFFIFLLAGAVYVYSESSMNACGNTSFVTKQAVKNAGEDRATKIPFV